MMFRIVFWDVLPCKIFFDWDDVVRDDDGGSTLL
jgi:hypothetical protein